MEILDEYGIDPYEYLGVSMTSTSKEVKIKYKAMAKKIHPDKTGGRTEAEFKILNISYKHIIKNCVDKPEATFEQLKNQPREEEQARSKNFHDIDFDDPETRKEIFVDDGIDLDLFEKKMKRVQSMSTTYSDDKFYRKEVMNTMDHNGRFNNERFNAFFLKMKKDGKIENKLIIREKVVASNNDDDYVNVNVYGENMLYSVDGGHENYIELLNQKEIKSKDIENLKDTDISVIRELIRENKNNTGKMAKKELKKLEQKAGIKIPIKTDLSFDRAIKKINEDNIKIKELSNKKQMEYIKKNDRVFANRVMYR